MDYFRHLGATSTSSSAKAKREQSAREDSPISDIDDNFNDGKAIITDDSIKAVLDAAERANAAVGHAGPSTEQVIAGSVADDKGRVKAEQRVVEEEDVEMNEGFEMHKTQQDKEEEQEVDELLDEGTAEEIERRRERERKPSHEASASLPGAMNGDGEAAGAIAAATADTAATVVVAVAGSAGMEISDADNAEDKAPLTPRPATPLPAVTNHGTRTQFNPHERKAIPAPTSTCAPPLPQPGIPNRRDGLISIVIRDTNNYATFLRCKPTSKF